MIYHNVLSLSETTQSCIFNVVVEINIPGEHFRDIHT